MVHKFFIMLMCVFGLSACSTAYGEEVLNLELSCEGTASFEIGLSEEGQGFEKLLNGLIASEISKTKEEFSNRLSIKDGMVGKIPLEISETYIEVDFDKLPKSLLEELPPEMHGYKIATFWASIDRLTGQLNGRFEAAPITDAADHKTQKSEEELFKMLAVQVNGKCTKLDPEKKLF